ncbi:6370_t:CDS:2, partial [Acaulospora colombiana]
HWHGIIQKGTNWYDGVPGVTQCPIPNGADFSYVFTLQQSGTYWYHSHLLAQLADGLRGPMIIHDPNDPNKDRYDYEYAMTVSDWYHTPTGDPGMLPLLHSANYTGLDPVPDSGEISGVGQYKCTIPNCTPSKFATYKVKQGKRYRFRIINISAMSHFVVSIDKHPLTIIEVDGTPTRPATVEVLPINVAQRYSVVVSANQPIGNYWIRARLSNCSLLVNDDTINANSSVFGNENITGILGYFGASSTIPDSKPYDDNARTCYDVDSSLLKPYPLNPPVPPQNANVRRINMKINIQVINSRIQATLNDSSYVPDFTYPSNQKVIDGTDFVSSDNAYSYNKLNEPIEIVLNNTLDQTHPFHLHGHTFWVVAQGEAGSYNKSLDSLKHNFDNPPYRDTATIKEL